MTNPELATVDTTAWTPEPIMLPEGFDDRFDRDLNHEEVVELKARFAGDDPDSEEYRAAICGTITLEMCTNEALRRFQEEIPEGVNRVKLSSGPALETPSQFALSVAIQTVNWQHWLSKAVALPGSEWPEYMSPPSTFVGAEAVLQHLQNTWGEED
jgi:hypothetical protein